MGSPRRNKSFPRTSGGANIQLPVSLEGYDAADVRTVVGFVNATLAGDSLWGAVLPLSSAGGGAALFSAVHDGTLLCRLVGAVAQREVACTRGGAGGMSLFDCEANVERALPRRASRAARSPGCRRRRSSRASLCR